ncbi:hypothetical protein NPIL_398531 [Nephila pilipes]|uniref:Uncharacterized protein n=1 Tax=Nephila pilipes TaxID=299642 RepID=A0A8X6T1Z1_NEPPI|nr:hypothetical protein NPIL_398531 [Nephila pilipes]
MPEKSEQRYPLSKPIFSSFILNKQNIKSRYPVELNSRIIFLPAKEKKEIYPFRFFSKTVPDSSDVRNYSYHEKGGGRMLTETILSSLSARPPVGMGQIIPLQVSYYHRVEKRSLSYFSGIA